MAILPKARKPKWMTGGEHKDPATMVKVYVSPTPKVNGVNVYKTNRHRKLSENHRRDNPYCAYCLEKGIVRMANLLDHIIPINRGGSIWNSANHASSCNECHNVKRGKEAHGYVGPSMMDEEGFLIPYKK